MAYEIESGRQAGCDRREVMEYVKELKPELAPPAGFSAEDFFPHGSELAAAPKMEEISDVQTFEYPEAPGIVALVPQTPLTRGTPRQRINREAHEALMGCALTRREAQGVLTAITEGRIPHISINY